MNETTNNKTLDNLRYVFILIGVAALLISYFLVFTKYNEKNDTLSSEVDSLNEEYSELKKKAKYVPEKKEATEENNLLEELIYSEFDGGLSYQAEIMDTYNLKNDKKVSIPGLTLSQPASAYTFKNGYESNAMSYSFTTTGTYNDMKEVLKYFENYEGKRKVPTSVTFSYNDVEQTVTLSLNVTEYSVEGEEREQLPVNVSAYDKGVKNVFFEEIIIN